MTQISASWSQTSCGRNTLSPESHLSAASRCPSGVASLTTEYHPIGDSYSNTPFSGAVHFPELHNSKAASQNIKPACGTLPITDSGSCAYTEHLMIPPRVGTNNTSPNSSFGSSGSKSPGSDTSMDLTRAGYRLNLLCQATSHQQSINAKDKETSPSCLYAKQKMSAQNRKKDCTDSYATANAQNSFSWFNTGSELELVCL